MQLFLPVTEGRRFHMHSQSHSGAFIFEAIKFNITHGKPLVSIDVVAFCLEIDFRFVWNFMLNALNWFDSIQLRIDVYGSTYRMQLYPQN